MNEEHLFTKLSSRPMAASRTTLGSLSGRCVPLLGESVIDNAAYD